jgi:hypothetical protein
MPTLTIRSFTLGTVDFGVKGTLNDSLANLVNLDTFTIEPCYARGGGFQDLTGSVAVLGRMAMAPNSKLWTIAITGTGLNGTITAGLAYAKSSLTLVDNQFGAVDPDFCSGVTTPGVCKFNDAISTSSNQIHCPPTNGRCAANLKRCFYDSTTPSDGYCPGGKYWPSGDVSGCVTCPAGQSTGKQCNASCHDCPTPAPMPIMYSCNTSSGSCAADPRGSLSPGECIATCKPGQM